MITQATCINLANFGSAFRLQKKIIRHLGSTLNQNSIKLVVKHKLAGLGINASASDNANGFMANRATGKWNALSAPVFNERRSISILNSTFNTRRITVIEIRKGFSGRPNYAEFRWSSHFSGFEYSHDLLSSKNDGKLPPPKWPQMLGYWFLPLMLARTAGESLYRNCFRFKNYLIA